MLIKKTDEIKNNEITDEKHYFNRRNFLRGAILIGTAAATATLYRGLNAPNKKATGSFNAQNTTKASYVLPDGEKATDFADITNYNNFYEFSTDKQGVASASKNFITRPWTVSVEGLVHKPHVFDLDDLLKIAPLEDRVYRHRCVEAWSMVIPWLGLPLGKLLDFVQPTADAKYVQFTTLFDPKRMPNQSSGILDWPYREGLRLDEAMHPLTILAAGLYGQKLLPQNGAPLRLVVPWKYGFKGCKSIVKIELTAKQPQTTWNMANADEYGFYSNVNPTVDHPRWSQATERRIGEFGLRKTLMFNGYADQVGNLYRGMDLAVNF
jgi:methionine sulfoxide reductase catalytic subunit